MGVTLSPSQTNTTVFSTPEFQSWGPIPSETTYVYNTNVGSLPLAKTVIHTIKDFIGTPQESGYNLLRCNITLFGGNNASPQWFSCTELPLQSTIVTLLPLENGMDYTLHHQLANLNLLAVGNYTTSIRFQVMGRLPSNVWEIIENHYHTINLTVTNELFTYSPASLNFLHLSGTVPMPTKEVTISGSSWRLALTPKFDVSTDETEGVDIIIVPILNTRLVEGTGTRTIKITLSEDYNDPVPPSTQSSYFRLSSGGTFVADILYSITLLLIDGTIAVNPRFIEFTAIKGNVEPVPIFVSVEAIVDITPVASPWLIVTEGFQEINGVLTPGYFIVPIPTQNMELGIYEGFVDLQFEYESETIAVRVNVIYNLIGFVSSPYSGNGFTLDTAFFEFNAENDLVYYETVQDIKTFDFFDDVENNVSIPEKFPLYKRKSSFNIGERLHRIMARFPLPNENYHQYKPAEVVLNVVERALLDNEILRETTLPVQKYIAGLSDNITVPCTFLDINPNMKRTTVSSHEFLNMLLPNEPVTLETYKNGIIHSSEELPLSYDKVVSKKVSFADFQQGDVILFVLKTAAIETLDISKKYAVLPEGRYLNEIVWENEFLLQSVLHCLGTFSTKTEFTVTSMQKFERLVEVLEHLEVRKKSNFTINTGWILKNDAISIESLMVSKRIWIKNGNEWLEVRPISKSIINTDSERELYDYQLEFQLNRKNNAKTYSF